MRSRILLFVLAVLPALSALIFAQDRTAFRLEAFLADVLERNPAIMSMEQEWIAARQVPARVGSYDDPMLIYTRWLSTPETRVGPQENVFMLNQRIPFPGKLSAMEGMATEDADAAGEQYAISRRDIILKAKQLYYELFRIDASLSVIDEYLQLLRGFLSVAETEYATGQGIQANVFRTQVEVSNILDKQIQFRSLRSGIVARMNALRDRPEGTPIRAATTVDLNVITAADSLLIETALGGRQELSIVSAMVRKSSLAQEFADLDYLPNFTLSASYVTIPGGLSPAPDAGKDPYSIGIGINIPLMLGRRSAAVEETRARHAASELRLANLRNDIRSEVIDLLSRAKESRSSLDLYEQGLLRQAGSSLESAMSAYQTGKLEYLSLLDAYRMILHVRLGYIMEQSRYQKIVAALERSVGGRMP